MFFIDEIKLLRTFFKNKLAFFNEVNIYKYFSLNRKNHNKNNLEIFNINYMNRYLNLLSQIYRKDYSKSNYSKIVFVESFINHPLYTLPNCYITKILCKIEKADCYGLLRSGDVKGSKIMEAFGINKIIYINQGNFFLRLFYIFLSIKYLNKINTIEELIKFKINKIDFGQAIYEQYIRFNKDPNINKIKYDFYLLLSKALIYNKQFEKIFKLAKKTFLVQSETQYFPFRLSLQNSLKFKHKVISRRGLSENGIRMYKNFYERNENRNKISKKNFYNLFNKLNKKKNKKINNYFKSQKTKKFGKEIYQKLNNKKNQKTLYNKKNVCSYFKWNEKKPIVIILAHELTDGNLNNKWNLFNNDMFWLKETLEKISVIKDVNWLIKPHPSEKVYNSKITTYDLFKKYADNNENVSLYPENLKILISKKIFKCAITSHGTAGYEFPCAEIPTIICGDTPYSSLGFNIEPKTKSQYFDILNNIKKIKEMNILSVKKCRFFLYLKDFICVVKNPLIYESDITMDYNKEKFWKNSYKILNKYKNFNKCYEESLSNQIKFNNSILTNVKRNSPINLNLYKEKI